MKLQRISCIIALVLFGATTFAVQADHSSATNVTTSLIKSTLSNDFECFNDALSPQSRQIIAAQEEPQKLFNDFSKSVHKVLEQIPEDQRPFVTLLLINQFQKIAKRIDGKWYIDAVALMKNVQ